MLNRTFRFAALGIVLLTIATRLPSLQHPQAIDDEAAYSVVANEIVDGGRPYIDAVDRKPPLLFWTYAAVFEVAGKYNWRRFTLSRFSGRWGRWLASILSVDGCLIAKPV